MSNDRSAEDELARLYSMLHQGQEGDISFYLEQCRAADTVLELGCGYGRLLGELARTGARVTGLDFAPAMLRLADHNLQSLHPEFRRRVKLVQADMRDFHFESASDRILIPFNGLYCLPDDDAVRDCFRAARRHLIDDGRLIFDTYTVYPEDEPESGDDMDGSFEHLTTFRDGPEVIEVHERDRWDPQRQTIAATYLFTRRIDGAPSQLRQTIRHRYFGLETVLGILEETGFQVVEEYGGFKGEALGRESDWRVIVAAPVGSGQVSS